MPTNNPETLVLLGKTNGLTVLSTKTPLTRLNYFDGKFLRAADLKDEQDYLRRLVQFSNQADGPGVAHGFDLTTPGGGDTLLVGPGLAIDPAGRVLLLPGSTSMSITELIEKSRNQDLVSTAAVKKEAKESGFADCEVASATPPTNVLQPSDMYLITVAHAEGYCGEEYVYGKLCEEACSTSTARPFVVEGLVFRAEPLPLKTLPATSRAVALTQAHRRSLVASAYFNDERNQTASLISGAGLKSDVWCFGADGVSGGAVALGVLCRAGTSTLFLDMWTVRRERIDTPAKRYWQWRMRMRPWDVFLAHILQFQCQLRDLFRTTPVPGATDPCDEAHKLVDEASEMLAEVSKFYEAVSGNLVGLPFNRLNLTTLPGGLGGIKGFQQKLQRAKEARLLVPSNRLLINGGIVELPSAGYLPVAPGEALSVNEQVERMMGEGVDLRFCVVRSDYVAHALEEAQHMERISLIEGLDDPKRKPQVDILVPDGEIIEEKRVAGGGFEADLYLLPALINNIARSVLPSLMRTKTPFNITVPFRGAERSEVLPGGGRAVHIALLLDEKSLINMFSGMTRDPNFIASHETSTGSTGTSKVSQNMDETEDASSAGFNAEEASAPEASAPEASAPSTRLFTRLKRAALRMSLGETTVRTPSAQNSRMDASFSEDAPFNVEAQIPTVFDSFAMTQPIVEAGCWITMKCNKDPWKLQAGQMFQVEGRIVAALSSSVFQALGSAYFDGYVRADVLVNAVDSSAGQKTFRCSVSAFGSIITMHNGRKEPDAATVNINVEFSWGTLGGGGKSAEITMHNPQGPGGIRFKVMWGKQPLEVEALAILKYEDGLEVKEIEIIRTRLRSNPDVLKPDNERHAQALKALQIIGSALNSPAFYDMSSALLFPPPAAPSAELIVRGTRDWVLFHRRRTEQCGIETTVASPSRRYRVYQMAFTYGQAGNEVPRTPPTAEDLLGISPEGWRQFTPIGVVSFGSGVATIDGNISAVKSAWTSVPGGSIIWGAIASRGDAVNDGDALAQARVKTLEAALDTIDPAARVDVLPIVPPLAESADVDGIILLFNGRPGRKYRYTGYSGNIATGQTGIGAKNL